MSRRSGGELSSEKSTSTEGSFLFVQDFPTGGEPLSPDALPEEPGLEWGVLIGRGATGVVHSARDLGADREVAVKILHSGFGEAALSRRFQSEIEHLGRLRHRNIASILRAGELGDGRPYAVLELVRGRSITRYAKESQLSRRARMELLLGVCDGLAHAHSRGLIHRDLKPGNILVGEEGIPHIVDFGLAISLEPGASRHTLPGRVVGTRRYMSPEQREGLPEVDARTDIFSLGVVALELLTGVVITSADRSAPRAEGVDESVRTSALGSLPRNLSRLLRLATEPRRELRSLTAEQLADDLRRVLADLPIRAVAVGRGERALLFFRRHPTELLILAGGLLGFLLAVGLSTSALLRSAEQEQLADELQRQTEAVLETLRDELGEHEAEPLAPRAPPPSIEDRGRQGEGSGGGADGGPRSG